jgi:3-hydroxybutyryl-CoA dehydrogenase
MGSGIAQTAAVAGFATTVHDVAEALLAKGRAGIQKALGRLVEKEKISGKARDAALGRLGFVTDLPALQDCDIVIEAVTEDLELKNRIWRELDRICSPRTIFASNTSSLTIASMARATSRADRFVGLHFFNPVPLMPLVEVIRSESTSPQTFERAFAFAQALGKEPVAAVDRPGFIVNLLLVPFLLDAVRALEGGAASVVTWTGQCSWVAATLWVRSRCSISSDWTRSCALPTSCSRPTATTAMRRLSCFGRWWTADSMAGKAARGFMITRSIRRCRLN